MSRRLPALALAALLMIATACGGDDEKSEATKELGPGIVGTVDEPESNGGCKTNLEVTRIGDSGDPADRESFTAIHPAVVGSADGRSLTLYASDEKLNLGALPESPRKDDNNLLVMEIEAIDEEGADPLVRGQQVSSQDADEDLTYLIYTSLQGSEADLEPVDSAEYDVQLTELGIAGEGVCARIRYFDSEKTVVGRLFAPLAVAPAQ